MGDRLYFERFLWFDKEVRSGRYPNAAVLAERFECSVKTGQRCIETFRDRYLAPLEYDPGRRGYFYRDPDYALPLTRLNSDELLALMVSRKLLSDASAGALGEPLGRLSDRLGRLLAESLPGPIDPDAAFSFRWTNVTACDPAIFRLVLTALTTRQPLAFRYYSPHGDRITTRTVEPHHLTNYQGAWHCLAWCRLRKAWRDFGLARMDQVRIEAGTFVRRPEADWRPALEAHFGIFRGPEAFEATLRFAPEPARWARGLTWHPRQRLEETPDGALIVTVPASHPTEIMAEILRYGAQVEVLAPDWLRRRVREEIDRMSKKYST